MPSTVAPAGAASTAIVVRDVRIIGSAIYSAKDFLPLYQELPTLEQSNNHENRDGLVAGSDDRPEIEAVARKARFEDGSWLRENSEIEFANGNFVSTSINLKNKSAGDGCRDETIEKAILRAFRARTFSPSQGQSEIAIEVVPTKVAKIKSRPKAALQI